MTIEISKIRPGDRVTLVPLEVVDVTRLTVDVIFKDECHTVLKTQIAAHHPAPREFQVGDRVRAMTKQVSAVFGTIRAVDGGEAWVRWDDHDANWSAEIQALTLVEGGE